MNDDFLLVYFSLWKEGDKKECFFCQHEYCFYWAPMLIRNNSLFGTLYPQQIDQCGNVACLSKTIWSGYHNHQITSSWEKIIGRSNDAGWWKHWCCHIFMGSVSPKLIILWVQLSINSTPTSAHNISTLQCSEFTFHTNSLGHSH